MLVVLTAKQEITLAIEAGFIGEAAFQNNRILVTQVGVRDCRAAGLDFKQFYFGSITVTAQLYAVNVGGYTPPGQVIVTATDKLLQASRHRRVA
jgi:hypothetical protein